MMEILDLEIFVVVESGKSKWWFLYFDIESHYSASIRSV